MVCSKDPSRFVIIDNPTDEETKIINDGLECHNNDQTNGEFNKPEIKINLVLKDSKGTIVGGLNASTKFQVMHLEVFCVEEKYRGLSYGRGLLLEAERIGKGNGCITSQTWTFSFQVPEFFQKLGYEAFGVSKGYPNAIREFYFIKRF